MGPISQYRVEPFSLEPGDPDFRTTLGVLAHEVGHRWLASVRYDSGGGPRTDLLGVDGAHWSFLLSSDASFLYGNAWEPVGGDLYRSVETQSRFSELDLYLMGFLAPEEVSPLSLLVNPELDPTRLPELGAEIEASDVETVTVGQIIVVEGARSPNHDLSQKDFAVAFVFLTAESLLPTARDLEAVELIRSNFMDTFFRLTRGRALVDPDLQTVAPVTPGALPDTSLAISWLLGQQQPDGRFEAHPLTVLRDTSTAVVALSTLGIRGTPVDETEDVGRSRFQNADRPRYPDAASMDSGTLDRSRRERTFRRHEVGRRLGATRRMARNARTLEAQPLRCARETREHGVGHRR